MLFNFTNGRIFYHKLLHYGVIISSKDETLNIFLIDTFKGYTIDASKFYEDIDDTYVSSMTLKIALNLKLYIPLLSDNNINNYNKDDINIIFTSNNSFSFSYLNNTYYVYLKDNLIVFDGLNKTNKGLFIKAIDKYLNKNKISLEETKSYTFNENDTKDAINSYLINNENITPSALSNKFKDLFNKDYIKAINYLKSVINETDANTLNKITNKLGDKKYRQEQYRLDPSDVFYYLMTVNKAMSKGISLGYRTFYNFFDYASYLNFESVSYLLIIYTELNDKYNSLHININKCLNFNFIPFTRLSMKLVDDNFDKINFNEINIRHLLSFILSSNDNLASKIFNLLSDDYKFEIYFRLPIFLTLKNIKYNPNLDDEFLINLLKDQNTSLDYQLFFKDYMPKLVTLNLNKELLTLLITLKANKPSFNEDFAYYINTYFKDYNFLIYMNNIDVKYVYKNQTQLVKSDIFNTLKNTNFHVFMGFNMNNYFQIGDYDESFNIVDLNSYFKESNKYDYGF